MVYRVVKPFAIHPFRFVAGEKVSEIELGAFKSEIVSAGCLAPWVEPAVVAYEPVEPAPVKTAKPKKEYR